MEQWDEIDTDDLMANSDFRSALESNDLVKAGELANIILNGGAKSPIEAKAMKPFSRRRREYR